MVVDLPGAYLTAALRLTGCVHLQLPQGVKLLAGDKASRSKGAGDPCSMAAVTASNEKHCRCACPAHGCSMVPLHCLLAA